MDTLSTNTSYIVVAPEKPADKGLTKRISRAVADIESVKEAHLPTVIELGKFDAPRLTLFVVVEKATDTQKVADLLKQRLSGWFSLTSKVDLKVVDQDFPMLDSVRETGCVIGWRD
jgi:hypothetical protein